MSKENNTTDLDGFILEDEFTVEELIEVLQQCPKDYKVKVHTDLFGGVCDIEIVGIDQENNEVTLFVND